MNTSGINFDVLEDGPGDELPVELHWHSKILSLST